VPVRVRVEENPAKQLGFGIGYSTDTGPRGRVEYSDLNVRERGWRSRTRLDVDKITQSLSGALDFPLRADGARDSVSGSLTHRDLEGEITDTARVGVSRSQHVGPFERVLTLQYLQETQSVTGAQTDSRRALPLNSSWTRRAVDNLLYPNRGYLLTFQLGGAHEALLTDRTFVRTYAKAVRYFPFGDRSSLVLRGEGGAVEAESRQGIPSDFLFRAGGDQSVRGYGYQTLGVQEGEAVVGGRYLAVVSAEYVFWFRPKWGAAIFYDRGDAADTVADLDPVAGYGLGARWRSPVGPINLDVAYGEEPGRYRLHAAVGFVF
jgi:translocation and assembly module TamA